MLVTDPCEEGCDRGVIGMVEKNCDADAPRLSDETHRFADRSAKWRVTARGAATGNIYGPAGRAECDRDTFSRASTGARDNADHMRSSSERPRVARDNHEVAVDLTGTRYHVAYRAGRKNRVRTVAIRSPPIIA